MQSGVIKASITQTNDENDWFADEELQTEPFEKADKFNQAPRDLTVNYDEHKEQENPKTKLKKRGNDAIALEKFISQAAPVMEKLVEANNVEYAQNTSKGAAAKRNAVELHSTLKFPKDFLLLFSDDDCKPADLDKITCFHMFEGSPESKIAIAYIIRKANGEQINLVIVYAVTDRGQPQAVFVIPQQVTQMCTTGGTELLLIATELGSMYLFDLKNAPLNIA